MQETPRRNRGWQKWQAAFERAGVTLDQRGFSTDEVRGHADPLMITIRHGRDQQAHETDIRIEGLGHRPGELSVTRRSGPVSRMWGAPHLETGDLDFDGAVDLRGSRVLACVLLDASTRCGLGRLIGGEAVSTFEGHEVVTPVEAALTDGTLNVIATNRRFPPQAFPPLVALAKRLVRPTDVATRIAHNFAKEPLPAVRLTSLETLIAEFSDHPCTRKTLTAALHDPADEVRLAAAKAVGPDGVRTLLAIVLGLPSSDARTLDAMALLGNALTPRHLARLLKRAVQAERLAIVFACLERLVRAADARSPAAVAATLETTGSVIAQVLLREATAPDEVAEAVTRRCVAALQIAPVAFADAMSRRLVGLLHGASDDGAEAITRRLVASDSPCLEATWVGMLDHRLRTVQLEAAAALGRTGSADAVAPLRDWTTRNLFDRGIQAAARNAIAEIQSRLEGALPGEGPSDWGVVKKYFLVQVGSLLTPPIKRLDIQARTVDVDVR
jgi:hypothetical protein